MTPGSTIGRCSHQASRRDRASAWLRWRRNALRQTGASAPASASSCAWHGSPAAACWCCAATRRRASRPCSTTPASRQTACWCSHASGVESEAQLPFAVLHQLLRPVLGELARCPGPQASALRGALGLEDVGGDERFLVSAAVLSLLDEAATGRRCCAWSTTPTGSTRPRPAPGRSSPAGSRPRPSSCCSRPGKARPAASRRRGCPSRARRGPRPRGRGELLEASAGRSQPAAARPARRRHRRHAAGPARAPVALSAAQLGRATSRRLDPLPVGRPGRAGVPGRVERLPARHRTPAAVAAADDEGDAGRRC